MQQRARHLLLAQNVLLFFGGQIIEDQGDVFVKPPSASRRPASDSLPPHLQCVRRCHDLFDADRRDLRADTAASRLT